MERKTGVSAGEGAHDILITREFDLPVELLFRAYVEPGLVEQWMGNRVVEMDSRTHGSYRFETSDARGNVLFRAHGSIHELIPDRKIVRTFEMENMPFPAQLEFLDFSALPGERSMLNMQIICRSASDRDQILKLPFAEGINGAHNRLQKVIADIR